MLWLNLQLYITHSTLSVVQHLSIPVMIDIWSKKMAEMLSEVDKNSIYFMEYLVNRYSNKSIGKIIDEILHRN